MLCQLHHTHMDICGLMAVGTVNDPLIPQVSNIYTYLQFAADGLELLFLSLIHI